MRPLALPVVIAVVLAAACSKKPEGEGELSAEDKKAKAEGTYLAASQAFMAGDYPEATRLFEEVKKLSPDDPRLPAAEGELLLAQAKITDALAMFEKAVKIDPKRATNYSRIGYIQQIKGNREAAVAALTKAIELNPRDFNAYEAMGDVYVKDGKIDDAVASFMKAAEVGPDEIKVGLVFKASQEVDKAGFPDRALTMQEEAWKKGLKSVELLTELGDRLVQKGRLLEAANVYTDAARLEKADPTLWELVGELYVKLDKPGDAEAAFRESLKVKDRGVVHVALARMCLQRKDSACVKSEVDLALEKATGEEPREITELTELLAEVGRPSDAAKLLGEYASEEPNHGDGKLQLRAAQLAKAAGDKAAVEAFCKRAMASDAGFKKCP